MEQEHQDKEKKGFAIYLITITVTATFLSVGYSLFFYGHRIGQYQAEIFKDWLWFLGVCFVIVVVYWFRKAVPQLEKILGILGNIRIGRQSEPASITPAPTYNPTPISTDTNVMIQNIGTPQLQNITTNGNTN